MPQLQEGDEIVHINGRIVKELAHQEVLSFLQLIPSAHSLSFNSQLEIQILRTYYLSFLQCQF